MLGKPFYGDNLYDRLSRAAGAAAGIIENPEGFEFLWGKKFSELKKTHAELCDSVTVAHGSEELSVYTLQCDMPDMLGNSEGRSQFFSWFLNAHDSEILVICFSNALILYQPYEGWVDFRPKRRFRRADLQSLARFWADRKKFDVRYSGTAGIRPLLAIKHNGGNEADQLIEEMRIFLDLTRSDWKSDSGQRILS
jgi:hypothetical protein